MPGAGSPKVVPFVAVNDVQRPGRQHSGVRDRAGAFLPQVEQQGGLDCRAGRIRSALCDPFPANTMPTRPGLSAEMHWLHPGLKCKIRTPVPIV
jgi:hypothetical protein